LIGVTDIYIMIGAYKHINYSNSRSLNFKDLSVASQKGRVGNFKPNVAIAS